MAQNLSLQKHKNKLQEEGPAYRVFTVFNTLFLILAVICTFYPIYYVLIASISSASGLAANYGMLWLPIQPVSLTAYEMVFRNSLVLSGYANTLIVLIVGLMFNMALTVMGAYALSLNGAMFTKPISLLVLFTMYFSGGMIPTYFNIKNLGLMDTLWSLILPGAVNTYNLLIMRSAFAAMPDSLYEAAYLDGAQRIERAPLLRESPTHVRQFDHAHATERYQRALERSRRIGGQHHALRIVTQNVSQLLKRQPLRSIIIDINIIQQAVKVAYVIALRRFRQFSYLIIGRYAV